MPSPPCFAEPRLAGGGSQVWNAFRRRLQAAEFRFRARFGELERQFEAKASLLRSAYLEEVAAIQAA
jgi:hypothetical protein